MYQLVATTAISGALAAMLARRLLFTRAAQLIVPPELEPGK
jgi:ABC-type iron transport system FetAB permease component